MNVLDSGYKDRDFDDLLIKVHKSKDIYKDYPILKKYPAFDLDKNVIEYIVLAFDRKSPLNDITQVIERRVTAAKMVFPFREKFTEDVEKIILCENQVVNLGIIQYLILQKNTEWTVFVSFEEAIRKESQKLLDGSEDSKDIIKNITELRTQLKVIKEDLIEDNTDLEKSIYDYLEVDNLGITPEEIADLYARNL